jgi:hypothetical protein
MEATVKMLMDALSQFDENTIVAIGLGEHDSADISRIEYDTGSNLIYICFEETLDNSAE